MKKPILIWITQCLSVVFLTYASWRVVRLLFVVRFAANPSFPWARFLISIVVQLSIVAAFGIVLYATIKRPIWARIPCLLFALGLVTIFLFAALHPAAHPIFQIQPGTAEAVGATVGKWLPTALAMFYTWRMYASFEVEKYLTGKTSPRRLG